MPFVEAIFAVGAALATKAAVTAGGATAVTTAGSAVTAAPGLGLMCFEMATIFVAGVVTILWPKEETTAASELAIVGRPSLSSPQPPRQPHQGQQGAHHGHLPSIRNLLVSSPPSQIARATFVVIVVIASGRSTLGHGRLVWRIMLSGAGRLLLLLKQRMAGQGETRSVIDMTDEAGRQAARQMLAHLHAIRAASAATAAAAQPAEAAGERRRALPSGYETMSTAETFGERSPAAACAISPTPALCMSASARPAFSLRPDVLHRPLHRFFDTAALRASLPSVVQPNWATTPTEAIFGRALSLKTGSCGRVARCKEHSPGMEDVFFADASTSSVAMFDGVGGFFITYGVSSWFVAKSLATECSLEAQAVTANGRGVFYGGEGLPRNRAEAIILGGWQLASRCGRVGGTTAVVVALSEEAEGSICANIPNFGDSGAMVLRRPSSRQGLVEIHRTAPMVDPTEPNRPLAMLPLATSSNGTPTPTPTADQLKTQQTISVASVPVRDKDCIVVFSDGLSDNLSPTTIAQVLSPFGPTKDANAAATALVDAAARAAHDPNSRTPHGESRGRSGGKDDDISACVGWVVVDYPFLQQRERGDEMGGDEPVGEGSEAADSGGERDGNGEGEGEGEGQSRRQRWADMCEEGV
ncbi:unnamed protein product [Vitrella brassicaformis CCMP3155]|uniref:Protein phosphatase n=1 Tax=Vitrella brassicaformis (strain CCMP3155) TaxID=1169540 RepID=A0A0G4EGJ9_VITBC|nr:unnamed protein product [Vitrella brassicaformis CCMP3155]|eukprot:CEL94583.1 unnamed protein product [Vitrella brassicaformis CCMP3155]